MPVGTSRFSGLGLSLLNVALEPLGQKDRDNRCTEMMTWLRWAYFWSLRLSRIWIYLCIWGTFGELNPSHFRLSLRFVEWHDLGRSWPWSIWGNITSGFWIHLDTSGYIPNQFSDTRVFLVWSIYRIRSGGDEIARSDDLIAVIQEQRFDVRFDLWENMGIFQQKTWMAFGPFGCWLGLKYHDTK